MKRKLVLAGLLVFACHQLFAQQAKSNFTLSGKVVGRNTGMIWFDYADRTGKEIKDSTYLKNGAFSFTGNISAPSQALIAGNIKSLNMGGPNFAEIFISPGVMEISLHENDFKSFRLTGSVMQDDAYALNNQKAAILKVDSVFDMEFGNLNKEEKAGGNTEKLKAKRDSLYKAYQVYSRQAQTIDYNFIASHPKSYLSPYLMNYYFGSRKLSLDSAEMFYNSFTPEVKSSFSGKSIKADIVARKASAVGQIAPLFTKTDINGKALGLKSFRGKNYVILDFWASWCVPCREATPYIKQLYQKYHAKGLDVISLSWDNKEDAWKEAIAKDSTGIWHHVLANMYLPNDNSLRTMYAIEGIPTFVLIDKKGVIMGRWTGIGQDAEAQIDKMLAAATAK